MYTKKELVERSAQYFQKPGYKLMYATVDGNFFNESSRSYASSHARTNDLGAVITITRQEFTEAHPDVELPELENTTKPTEQHLNRFQDICKANGWPESQWEQMNLDQIQVFINSPHDEPDGEPVVNDNEVAANDIQKEAPALSVEPDGEIDWVPDMVTTEDAKAYNEANGGAKAVHKGKVSKGFIEWKKDN